MASKLRLYVWTGFSPDYTNGLAFAIAKDETQARALVTRAYGGAPYDWGTLRILSLKPVAYAVAGGG